MWGRAASDPGRQRAAPPGRVCRHRPLAAGEAGCAICAPGPELVRRARRRRASICGRRLALRAGGPQQVRANESGGAT